MKLKQSIYLFIVASMAVALLQSCGSSSGDKDKNSEEFKAAGESLDKQIEEVVYNMPSPTEIPGILQTTGAEFNQALLNSKANADKYLARNDKAALNLGVYVADIGYLISYDKTQEAIDYLEICKNLGNNLNVIGSFDAGILQRFEKNISNKDSLSRLLDNAVKHTDNYLKNDDRTKLAALFVTGSFVEGLYISTGLVKTYPKNLLPDDERNLVLTPIIQVVLQQKKSVAELLNLLTSVDQTAPVVSIVADLKKLETTYAAMNIEEQIHNNRADLVLSDKNLLEVTNIVERMRNGVIE